MPDSQSSASHKINLIELKPSNLPGKLVKTTANYFSTFQNNNLFCLPNIDVNPFATTWV